MTDGAAYSIFSDKTGKCLLKVSNNVFDIFKAYVPGSLVFYHNAVIQVISSMGLAGVAAYGWMLIKRLKMLWQGRKSTGVCAFALAYIGILMMSMTNPGIFCPFPEAGLLTLMFAMIEKEESI